MSDQGTMERIKSWHVILAGTLLLLGAGLRVERNVIAPQAAAAQRIRNLEIWRDSTVDPALKFLVCSQRATNAGTDPRVCEQLLRGVRELLAGPDRQ